MRKTVATGGWAILVFHDVQPQRRIEGETSQRSHRAILRWLADQPVWCAPLGEVFQYVTATVGAPRPSTRIARL